MLTYIKYLVTLSLRHILGPFAYASTKTYLVVSFLVHICNAYMTNKLKRTTCHSIICSIQLNVEMNYPQQLDEVSICSLPAYILSRAIDQSQRNHRFVTNTKGIGIRSSPWDMLAPPQNMHDVSTVSV